MKSREQNRRAHLGIVTGLLLLVSPYDLYAQSFFSDVTALLGVADSTGLSVGVAWGDFDNDGHLDFYLTNTAGRNARGEPIFPEPNRLFRNQDNGFVDVAAPFGVDDSSASVGAAWGDYDNDGDLDLFVANFTNGHQFPSQPNRLFRNEGDHFTDVARTAGLNQPKVVPSISGVWGDYDNDGDLDLFVGNWFEPNRLYRNEGNGQFQEVAAITLNTTQLDPSQAAEWADYDNDGDLDLFSASWGVAGPGPPARFYQNNNGTFANVAAAVGIAARLRSGAAWGDYDNDGDLDLFSANVDQPDELYRNDNGLFTEVGLAVGVADSGRGEGTAWGDYDNDGDLDLYVANLGQANRLYRNNGDGTFTDVAESLGVADTGQSQGVAWGDYDNDGDLDLYVANFGGSNRLYRNDGATQNWLKVYTVGQRSNRTGIGTRITVLAGGQIQIREVSGGLGFAQNALLVHFGVGSSEIIDTLKVRWSGGQRQVWTDLPVNRIFLAAEETATFQTDVSDIFFGSIETGTFKDTTITIINRGNDTLRVTHITTSDTAFTVRPTAFHVPPGQTFQDTLRFTPMTGDSVSATLLVFSNAPTSPDTMRVVGVGLTKTLTIPTDTSVIAFPTSDNTQATITFQAGAVAGHTVTLQPFGPVPPARVQVVPAFDQPLTYFEINATIPDTTAFAAQITITYTNTQLANAGITDASTLVAAWFDEARSSWNIVPTRVDTTANTVTFETNHFSIWAIASVTPTDIEDLTGPRETPKAFILYQNYPNPFNPETVIEYTLPEPAQVHLVIFNLRGQGVRTLVDAFQPAGYYRVAWDGRDSRGQVVSSAAYLYHLTAGELSRTKRMILLR